MTEQFKRNPHSPHVLREFNADVCQYVELRHPAPVIRPRCHEQLIVGVKPTRQYTGEEDEPEKQLLIRAKLSYVGQNRVQIHTDPETMEHNKPYPTFAYLPQ